MRSQALRETATASRVERWKRACDREIARSCNHRDGGGRGFAFWQVERGASPPAACRSGHREQTSTGPRGQSRDLGRSPSVAAVSGLHMECGL